METIKSEIKISIQTSEKLAEGFEATGNKYVANILDEQNLRLEECFALLEKESQRLLTAELERTKQSSAAIRQQVEAVLSEGLIGNKELA